MKSITQKRHEALERRSLNLASHIRAGWKEKAAIAKRECESLIAKLAGDSITKRYDMEVKYINNVVRP